VIIGAAKSGTSSLFTWLSEHPYVVAATRKELEYFSFQYDRGFDWYRHHFPAESDRADFATRHGREFLSFEASPYYLPHRLAPARMAEVLPDAKLIVTMRNPVDRAYSAYQMWRRWGSETEPFMTVAALEDGQLDGGRALEANHGIGRCETTAIPTHRVRRSAVPGRVHIGQMYLMGGRYAEQLERWFKHYPREQFHFVTMEDLASDPTGAYSRVQSFLGLPDYQAAELEPQYVGHYDAITSEDRAASRDYFRPYNERLYELLGRDLGWDADQAAAGSGSGLTTTVSAIATISSTGSSAQRACSRMASGLEAS
jgi:hypothetical protein